MILKGKHAELSISALSFGRHGPVTSGFFLFAFLANYDTLTTVNFSNLIANCSIFASIATYSK